MGKKKNQTNVEGSCPPLHNPLHTPSDRRAAWSAPTGCGGVGGWRGGGIVGRGDTLPISDAEGLCWVAGNTGALPLPPGHLLIYGAPTALICLGRDHLHRSPTPPPPPIPGLWATVRLYLTLEMSTWTNEGGGWEGPDNKGSMEGEETGVFRGRAGQTVWEWWSEINKKGDLRNGLY